jgi:hypothetical protein
VTPARTPLIYLRLRDIDAITEEFGAAVEQMPWGAEAWLRAFRRPDLQGELPLSDRESPLVTAINGLLWPGTATGIELPIVAFQAARIQVARDVRASFGCLPPPAFHLGSIWAPHETPRLLGDGEDHAMAEELTRPRTL